MPTHIPYDGLMPLKRDLRGVRPENQIYIRSEFPRRTKYFFFWRNLSRKPDIAFHTLEQGPGSIHRAQQLPQLWKPLNFLQLFNQLRIVFEVAITKGTVFRSPRNLQTLIPGAAFDRKIRLHELSVR